MPTYTYHCEKCAQVSEIQKPVSKFDAVEECSDCKTPLNRMFSTSALVFKGPGFYVNDYPKKDKK